MKKLITLACLGFVCAVSTPVYAGAQQEKMKGCNEEAKGMHGDERKAFMKKCLSKDYELKRGGPMMAPVAAAKQQDKMTMCNAEAKTKALMGAERKAFMSECLKK